MKSGSFTNSKFETHDGNELMLYEWACKKPTAYVHIVHGMSEHSARYDDFACWLNSKNIKVDDEKDTYQLKLFPWCPLTKQDKIPITADWVVTIVDPIDKIKQMYEKEVLGNGTSESADSDEQSDTDKST